MPSCDGQVLTGGGGAVADAWDAEHAADVNAAVAEAAAAAAAVECSYCWHSTTASGWQRPGFLPRSLGNHSTSCMPRES